jgi:hypothetical protein
MSSGYRDRALCDLCGQFYCINELELDCIAGTFLCRGCSELVPSIELVFPIEESSVSGRILTCLRRVFYRALTR